LAIVIPIAGLTATSVAGSFLSASYALTLSRAGTRQDATVIVDHLDPTLLAVISRQHNVEAAQLATVVDTQWHVDAAPGHVDLQIVGYPEPSHVPVTPLRLVAGRYPGPGEVVMGFGDRALGTVTIGHRMTVDTGEGPASLLVVGVAQTAGLNPATSGEAEAFMSTAGLDRLRAYSYSAGETSRQPIKTQALSLQLRDPGAFLRTAHDLERLIRSDHATVLAVQPPPQQAPVRQLGGILSLARVLLMVAVVLSAVLVTCATATLIAEQSETVATLKALGAPRSRIIRHYTLTIIAFGVVATPVGVALGTLLGSLLGSRLANSIPLTPAPLRLPPAALAAAAVVGLAMPVLASLVPIVATTRVTVREALSGWGISGDRSRLLPPRPPTPRLLRMARPRRMARPHVPQTVRLGTRALARRPWRAAVSILVVTLAALSFLVVQSVASSVETSIGSVWGSFRADVEIYVGGRSSYGQITSLIGQLPNIARTERVGWFGSHTSWGKVGVWGIEPDSSLHIAKVRTGRWFSSTDTRACLVSTDLARRAGLHAGSTIDVPGPGGTRSMRFTVVGTVDEPVDDLSQVGTVDLAVNDLYELEGAPAGNIRDYTNRVLVQATDRSSPAVDRLTRAIDGIGRAQADGRNGPIASVFRFHDEVVRHQRNFLPVQALLLVASALVGLVGVLGLADAVGTAVLDQRREIGLLRCLGASGRQVATVVWTQALAVSVTAWAVAAAAGVPIASMFVDLFRREVMPTDFSFNPVSLLAMVLVTLLTATAAAVLPASRAAQLRPAELLRSE
jgi:putative ABC transport system permease protein